ncbi:pentapeptide repeat-containing protein [Listeria monocytogenes]|nr:pentapeptide repeat-containing protein [Listeria monocytogenes]
MKQEELDIILEKHGKWLRDEGGERADLKGANLSNASLRHAFLRHAFLRHAFLRHADLSGADLRYADLGNAFLSDADLSDADLSNADLKHASLSNADLSNADLKHASLSNADLSNADLKHADLSNADLSNASLRHAEGLTVICVQVDTSRRNNQITYIKELEIWIKDGFQGTLDELKASVEQTHKDNEKLRKRYYRVIDFILNEVGNEKIRIKIGWSKLWKNSEN